MLESKICS